MSLSSEDLLQLIMREREEVIFERTDPRDDYFLKDEEKDLKKEEKERLKSEMYREQVPAMVHAHFERVRKADVCYIYNKNGYLGINTTLELGYAHGKGMIIYALEHEQPYDAGGEICRDILFFEIVKTPEELVKRLQ